MSEGTEAAAYVAGAVSSVIVAIPGAESDLAVAFGPLEEGL
jgi:hypothetical protein